MTYTGRAVFVGTAAGILAYTLFMFILAASGVFASTAPKKPLHCLTYHHPVTLVGVPKPYRVLYCPEHEK